MFPKKDNAKTTSPVVTVLDVPDQALGRKSLRAPLPEVLPDCGPSRPLETVIADWRSDAQVLRRQGHVHDAELIERLCADVERGAEDYLTWLPETQAVLQSGHAVAWLRRRFAEWAAQGYARKVGRQREYRALVIPRRTQLELAYRAGERAADEERVA